MTTFFHDDDLQFLTLIALGSTAYQAADVGEVLSTVARIHEHKPATWVEAWNATAERVRAGADASAEAGHRLSASRAYLRASMYHAMATNQADAAGGSPTFAEVWERSRSCWDRFCELHPVVGEPFTFPYEDTTLPGWFFRAPGADGPTRTLIVNNGSDGPNVSAWVQGAAAAIERGWNAVIFDGPGQNAALVRQGLAFRADWEAVITPLVDHLVTRPDVAADRIALLGVSQAGYWVPRAAAHEPRLAAIVVDPGVVDVSTTLLDHLPHSMTKLLDAGDQAKFDRNMHMSERFSKSMKAMLALRFRPYGTDSAYEAFATARTFALTDDDIAAIRCPVLVADPEHEQFWPGQAQELYDRLTGDKALVRFTAEEGADSHCEPGANALRAERFFDWLDEEVPA